MHRELNREPTVEELAAEVEEPVEKIRRSAGGSPAAVARLPVGDEDESASATSSRTKTPQLPLMLRRATCWPRLLVILVELSDREQEVVRLRFGLEDGRPRTLEEVGRQFGVTRADPSDRGQDTCQATAQIGRDYLEGPEIRSPRTIRVGPECFARRARGSSAGRASDC